ncbi:MAG: helix-turn-helix transcriptional regulator [Deltaproteobacteria bacterium]|nr:helix-turn-helix transcriptional regulator [Deltaproteobacteria bacterium]
MDLITLRAKLRKTQWDLKVLTGIHQSKLSLMERGYIEPTKREKALIAKALGFSVNEIDWPADSGSRAKVDNFINDLNRD